MNHEENMVEEAIRTFQYIAFAAGSEVDLLYALALLKRRVEEEIDDALDLMIEIGEEDDDDE
jgi:hypothetical protein